MGTLVIDNLGLTTDGEDRKAVSAAEKSALAGTAGTPGDANRFVTDSDARMSDARQPDFSAFGTAPAFETGDQLPTQRGTQTVMISADDLMSLIDWANGSGGSNVNQVDNSIHADEADNAQVAESANLLQGFGVVSSGPASSQSVVLTNSTTGKIDGSLLDLSVTTATVTLTDNGTGGLIISFGTAVAFPGNVSAAGHVTFTGGTVSMSSATRLNLPSNVYGQSSATYLSHTSQREFVETVTNSTMATMYGGNYHNKLYLISNGSATCIISAGASYTNRPCQFQNVGTGTALIKASAGGVRVAGVSGTQAHIYTSQQYAYARFWADASGNVALLNKGGEWRDAAGNLIP